MRILKHAIVASVIAGLVAPVAAPAIAESPPPPDPASSPAVVVQPAAASLADALLTEKDLPKGWAAFDTALMGNSLPGMLDPAAIGKDLCAMPEARSEAADPAVAEPPPAASKVKLELAAFMKDGEGPMLLETLAGTGKKLARDMVGDIREMLKRCPIVKNDSLGLEMTAIPKFRAFGDDSQAVAMRVTLKDGDFQISVPGKLVALASGDVYATVALVGSVEPTDAELKKLTKRALRKLKETV
jgi:hypothetical protein